MRRPVPDAGGDDQRTGRIEVKLDRRPKAGAGLSSPAPADVSLLNSRVAASGRGCLKLSRDRLELGVGVQSLVAHFTAPAGLLVTAERQRRVEHVVTVDPDGASPELLGQRVRLGDIPGPDAGAET